MHPELVIPSHSATGWRRPSGLRSCDCPYPALAAALPGMGASTSRGRKRRFHSPLKSPAERHASGHDLGRAEEPIVSLIPGLQPARNLSTERRERAFQPCRPCARSCHSAPRDPSGERERVTRNPYPGHALLSRQKSSSVDQHPGAGRSLRSHRLSRTLAVAQLRLDAAIHSMDAHPRRAVGIGHLLGGPPGLGFAWKLRIRLADAVNANLPANWGRPDLDHCRAHRYLPTGAAQKVRAACTQSEAIRRLPSDMPKNAGLNLRPPGPEPDSSTY